jgi:hypothetical protein
VEKKAWKDPMKAEPHKILSRLDRARRRAGLDRNPMRRREDHIQAAVAMLLVALFLVAAPWAASSIGSRVYGAGLSTEKTQTTERRQVVGTNSATAKTTQVTWREADGTSRAAKYQDSKMFTDGTTRVWVDRSGRITPEPRRRSQTITDASMAAVGVILALTLPLTMAYYVTRRYMDRSRYHLWDVDWERASVRWGLPGHRPDQS